MAGTVRLFFIYFWFIEGTDIQVVHYDQTTPLIAIPIQKYDLDVKEMSEFTSWLELLKSDEGEEIEDLNYDSDDDSDELFEGVSVSYIPVFHRTID